MCNASGEQPVGILQNQPRSGEIAQVRVIGRSKVKGATVIRGGQFAKTNHSGMALLAKSGDYVMAMALERSSNGTESHFMIALPRQTQL